MAIRVHNPTTPGRRGMTSQDFADITTKKPLKSLIKIRKGAVGRNNAGRITTRHRGSGVRRYYRDVNFKLAANSEATVEQIEYDPNRSARIARIKDQNGNYHYILATKGMKPGSKLVVQEEASIENGNRLPLKNIPAGTVIHAVELQAGKGAQLARTAGSSAQLVAKEENYAQIRLPSGEVRLVSVECMASVGTVGNEQHQNVQIGKAGRKRRMGIRPTVRGVVMAAADHPHGGGDGGRHRMGRPPTTPWGQKTLGYKTRRRKAGAKFIVRTRHQGKRR
ncbi:MAG TPA: 50S ribosomal protein L2 [Candidatus Saccharimonadales bacterium]|nr:50S ribosomal protein L2 [Candidatus Saccharimonadales bacterium]